MVRVILLKAGEGIQSHAGQSSAPAQCGTASDSIHHKGHERLHWHKATYVCTHYAWKYCNIWYIFFLMWVVCEPVKWCMLVWPAGLICLLAFLTHMSFMFVFWLLSIPATCKCTSEMHLPRQLYVLPHWDRRCRSNLLSHSGSVPDTRLASLSSDPAVPSTWQSS